MIEKSFYLNVHDVLQTRLQNIYLADTIRKTVSVKVQVCFNYLAAKELFLARFQLVHLPLSWSGNGRLSEASEASAKSGDAAPNNALSPSWSPSETETNFSLLQLQFSACLCRNGTLRYGGFIVMRLGRLFAYTVRDSLIRQHIKYECSIGQFGAKT